MPSLTQYENPDTSLKPENTGYATNETAARRIAGLSRQEADAIGGGISAVGKAAGQIGESEQQQEGQKLISTGIADFALLQANHTALWTQNIKTADPNQVDSLAGQAMQKLNEDGQAFLARSDNPVFQKWATHALGEYQAHFIAQAKADSAVAAGHALASNLGTAANANTKLVLDNPAMLDMALGQVDHNVDSAVAATPQLRPEAKGHIGDLKTRWKSELFGAAVQATMEKDPVAGRALLDDPKYAGLVNLQQRDHWQNYGTTITKTQLAQQKQNEAEARRVESDGYNQATSQLITGAIDPQTGQVRLQPDFLKQLLDTQRLPGAVQHPDRVRTLIDWYQAEVKRAAEGVPASTNPSVYQNFTGRIFLGPDDPNRLTEEQVYQQRAVGNLSDKDFNFFVKSVGASSRNPQLAADMKRADEFAKSYQTSFFKATMLDPGSPLGHQRYGEFQRDFQEDFQRRRAAGEAARAIEDDWVKRIPTYQQGLGNIQNIVPKIGPNGNFVPTAPAPPIVPRKPGESLSDWTVRAMPQLPAKK